MVDDGPPQIGRTDPGHLLQPNSHTWLDDIIVSDLALMLYSNSL